MPNITKPVNMSQVWSSSGMKTQPADSKIAQGWVVELPPYQTANYIENRQDQFGAHVNQHGVPTWDSSTEYQGGISITKGSNGKLYKCLVTNTNFDPINPLNSAQWSEAFEPFGSVAVVAADLATLTTNYGSLSGLSNVALARTNLSVYSKLESDTKFALLNGVGSQVFSVAPATLPAHAVRLDQINSLVVQATEASMGVAMIASFADASNGIDDTKFITPLKGKTTYLMRAGNLSDLSNIPQARTNLGLGSAAMQADTAFLKTASNLADLSSIPAARSNLGLGAAATRGDAYFLQSGLNLADVTNVSLARTNLGLGSAATRNVGTTVGTVAAGDDGRIVNAVQTYRAVSAGGGLTGGGYLSNNITLALGTPGTLGATTGNGVYGESHTHAIDINSWFGGRNLAPEGYYTFPGGFTVQWGAVYSIPRDGQKSQAFPVPFTSVFQVIGGKRNFTPTEGDGNACGAYAASNTTLIAFNDSINYTNSISYVALGYIAI